MTTRPAKSWGEGWLVIGSAKTTQGFRETEENYIATGKSCLATDPPSPRLRRTSSQINADSEKESFNHGLHEFHGSRKGAEGLLVQQSVKSVQSVVKKSLSSICEHLCSSVPINAR